MCVIPRRYSILKMRCAREETRRVEVSASTWPCLFRACSLYKAQAV